MSDENKLLEKCTSPTSAYADSKADLQLNASRHFNIFSGDVNVENKSDICSFCIREKLHQILL